MTHYTISYAELEPEAKRTKAIADIMEWLGAERYCAITQSFQAMAREGNKPTWQSFQWLLFLSGIEGYPLQAWYETLFGEIEEEPR